MAYGAIFTIRGKVGRCQAGCCYTIVARGTITGNTGMIKHCRYKSAAGYVADIAILICWNVSGMLADRTTSAAIMTGVAPFAYNVGSAVVDKSTEEISRVMAGAAIFAGVLVNCCICRPSGTNSHVVCTTIVARSTATSDTCMSKNRRYKCCDCMTEVTILTCRQMACCFGYILVTVSSRQKLTDMTTFTALGLARVYIIYKCC